MPYVEAKTALQLSNYEAQEVLPFNGVLPVTFTVTAANSPGFSIGFETYIPEVGVVNVRDGRLPSADMAYHLYYGSNQSEQAFGRCETDMGYGYQMQGSDGTLVWAKTAKPNLMSESAILPTTEVLIREAYFLSQLNHPGIIKTRGLAVTPDRRRLFLVTEFFPSVNLEDFLTTDYSLGDVWSIMQQLCSAVAYTHSKGIMHKDLWPPNVLVDTNGNIKLIDFALAQKMHPNASVDFPYAGKFEYTGDESLPRSNNNPPALISPASDVYSLNSILYALLTKKMLPNRINPDQLMLYHLSSQILRDFYAAFTRAGSADPNAYKLSSFLQKNAESEPNKRCQDVEAYQAGLNEVFLPVLQAA